MARLARVVVPGVAHHVTQRGNRRQPTFFQEDDYRAYLELLGEWCGRGGVEVWAYCLMPNHVHLIVVPESEDGLRRTLGEAHRRYTRRAARYVELNPVRAKLCRMPWRWPWSSAAAHVAGQEDAVVRLAPLRERVRDWREYLLEPLEAAQEQLWRQHERTDRPLGEPAFLDRIESLLGRPVRPGKPGRKPKWREK
jgi:putative transposase